MVEIGPGLGAITMPLLGRLGELHAVEIDRDAIRHLQAASAGHGVLHIHEGDALEFDLRQASAGGRAPSRGQSALQHLDAAAVSSD